MTAAARWGAFVAWIETWILFYGEDPILRPVLFSLLGHGVIVVVPLMLAVWRAGSVAAALGLVALFAASVLLAVLETRLLRRPGLWAVGLALTWVASVAGTWFSLRTGVL